MRVSVVKILLSVLLSALSLAAGLSYGCDLQDVHLSDTEICPAELEAAAEFGSSSYVDLTEPAILLEYCAESCDESDGSWGADAPEGAFPNDHPDEYSTYPAYPWKVLPVISQLIVNQELPDFCPVHPGSLYPPPQR